ncbi:MAG: serine hydrolase domain-containing protein [Oscillospiraceae bacterium]
MFQVEGFVRPNTLPRAFPGDLGVDPEGLMAFAEQFEALGGHAFMALRHGHVFAEGFCHPYGPQHLHPLFSITKSFTGIAVGFAVQEGLLSIDENLVDIFPEHLPAAPCENMAKMQVRHLLCHSTGHKALGPTTLSNNKKWVATFMQSYVALPPGTFFNYNNNASNMLSAIIQKRSGLPLKDYLAARFFQPLGIEQCRWETLADGSYAGALGLSLCIEDLAKMGQFMLQKGTWQDTQLLSPDWVAASTQLQADTSKAPSASPYYKMGYGYQFWLCDNEGTFRADGINSQLCVVLPKLHSVIAVTAGHSFNRDMHTLVFDTLVPAIHDDHTPDDPGLWRALDARLAAMHIAPCPGEGSCPDAAHYSGRQYKVTRSRIGITGFSLHFGAGDEADTLTLHCNKLSGTAETGKNGQWLFSDSFPAPDRYYPLLSTFSAKVACSGGWQNGRYHVRLVNLELPFVDELVFTFHAGAALMELCRTPRMDTIVTAPDQPDLQRYQFYGAEL